MLEQRSDSESNTALKYTGREETVFRTTDYWVPAGGAARMKRDELNDWLSLAANVGVIMGLVFLGLEINQSNKITAAATYQSRISEIEAAFQNQALSDDLPMIYDKIETEGIGSLTRIERRRIRDWETAKIYRMQGQYYQYQQGFLDDASYLAMVTAATSYLPLWNSLGVDFSAFDPDFMATITN